LNIFFTVFFETQEPSGEYIPLKEMLKAKLVAFFIADLIKNRNTVLFLGFFKFREQSMLLQRQVCHN
jgi:hypothetical protein